MSDKKIIAVCGATGCQGGGVVRDLLADGTFAVRGLTRNPDSPSAQELKKLGVEVVKADLEDVASLTEAFKGAHGVFGLTDFWSLFYAKNFDQAATKEHETQHGKNLVDAAKAAGIKHFVWSTLDRCENIRIYHFDSKADVHPYLEASGVPFTYVYTSFYYNNLGMFKMIAPQDDGSLLLSLPIVSDTKMHVFEGSDVGRWVVPILKGGEKYYGQSVHAVAEFISPREWIGPLERVSGKKVVLKEVTREEFFTDEYRLGPGGGDELWLNMRGWVDDEIKRDFANSLAVAPNPVTLDKFLEKDVTVRKLLGVA